jgi:hypothetical protein
MVWLLRVLVVGLLVFDSPIILAPNHRSLIANALIGLLTGLLLVWLSSWLGNRCQKLRTTYPLFANRIGIAFFVIGYAVAALCMGLAAFAAYMGARWELIVVSASTCILYWAAGWGLHSTLTGNADSRPIAQKHGEPVHGLDPRTDLAVLAPNVLVARKRRHRKVALSLAIIGALAGPFAFRTYEARPVYRAPLTAQEKEQFANAQEYCRQNDRNNEMALKRRNQMALLGLEGAPDSVVGMGDIVCSMGMGEFDPSGNYKYHFDRLEYLALNIGAAIVAFIAIFGLAFLIPNLVSGFAFLIRGYWNWLNA